MSTACEAQRVEVRWRHGRKCYLTRRLISMPMRPTDCAASSFCPAGRGTFATIARLQSQVRAWHVSVETQAKRFFVSGRVQGVGFRFFVERIAAELGVGGYVRNLFDGRVEVYAIGRAKQLEELGAALRRGPHMAAVDDVKEEDAEMVRKCADLFIIESDD